MSTWWRSLSFQGVKLNPFKGSTFTWINPFDDFFLYCYLKSKVYSIKPDTTDHCFVVNGNIFNNSACVFLCWSDFAFRFDKKGCKSTLLCVLQVKLWLVSCNTFICLFKNKHRAFFSRINPILKKFCCKGPLILMLQNRGAINV